MRSNLKPVRFQGITVPLYRYADGRTAFADSAGGPRKMRVFRSEAKARNEAEKLAIRLLNGEAARTEFKAADHAAYARALEILAPLNVSLTLAVEEYAAARAMCGGRSLLEVLRVGASNLELPTKLLRDVFDEFLLVKTAEGVDAHYQEQLKQLLKQFSTKHAGRNIADITAKDVQTHLLEMKVGYKRRFAARGSLVSAFRFARDMRNYLPSDTKTAPEKVECPGKPISSIATHKPNELRFWLRCVRKEYEPWLLITSFSGVRTEEVCPKPGSRKDRLAWSDFNWTKKTITIRPEVSKTGHKRIIPLLPNLEAWLLPWSGGSGAVLPAPLQIRFETRRLNKVSKALEKNPKALHPCPGLRWKQNANRHSYGSFRNAIIRNMPQLAEEMGNSVGIVKRNYHDAKEEAEAREFFAIMPANVADSIIQMKFSLAG